MAYFVDSPFPPLRIILSDESGSTIFLICIWMYRSKYICVGQFITHISQVYAHLSQRQIASVPSRITHGRVEEATLAESTYKLGGNAISRFPLEIEPCIALSVERGQPYIVKRRWTKSGRSEAGGKVTDWRTHRRHTQRSGRETLICRCRRRGSVQGLGFYCWCFYMRVVCFVRAEQYHVICNHQRVLCIMVIVELDNAVLVFSYAAMDYAFVIWE